LLADQLLRGPRGHNRVFTVTAPPGGASSTPTPWTFPDTSPYIGQGLPLADGACIERVRVWPGSEGPGKRHPRTRGRATSSPRPDECRFGVEAISAGSPERVDVPCAPALAGCASPWSQPRGRRNAAGAGGRKSTRGRGRAHQRIPHRPTASSANNPPADDTNGSESDKKDEEPDERP
jgi:hypothetical protein